MKSIMFYYYLGLVLIIVLNGDSDNFVVSLLIYNLSLIFMRLSEILFELIDIKHLKQEQCLDYKYFMVNRSNK